MSRTKKIFFFIDSFRVGGMHRQVYLIIKNINKSKFEPIIVTQSQYGGFRDQFLNLGCRTYNLGWKNRFSFFAILKMFIEILRKEKPECIFITQAPNFIYFKIANLFLPFKVSLIGSFRAMNFWVGNKSRLYLFIENYLVKLFYDKCEVVTANSNALVSHYSSLIKIQVEKPIFRIYNGIEFTTKKYTSTRKGLFSVSDSDIIIVMAARLDPMKDFDTLLRAAHLVCNKNHKIKLFLLGDGELKDDIIKQIEKSDLNRNVFLMGEVSDTAEYLRFADISVLATKGEGLSNSLLESMILDVPCIATAVGGNVELLESDKGILVNENDAAMLAESILLLTKNKEIRLKLIRSANGYVTEHFEIKKMVEAYEKIFSEVSHLTN